MIHEYNEGIANKSSSIPTECLTEYLSDLQKQYESHYLGRKRQIESLLLPETEVFPNNIVIARTIVPSDNIEIIKTALRESIKGGFFPGIRTISDKPLFFGAKTPWEMEINSERKITMFLKHSLSEWFTNPPGHIHLDPYLVIMHNPPTIGTRHGLPNQFVARFRFFSFVDEYPAKSIAHSNLLIEMTTGTNKLRVLDKKMELRNSEIMRYTCNYTPINRVSDKGTYFIGSLCTKKDRMILDNVINHVSNLINDRDIRLIERLEVLRNLSALDTIEFQGFVDINNSIQTMLIYGLQGPGDETKTGLHP